MLGDHRINSRPMHLGSQRQVTRLFVKRPGSTKGPNVRIPKPHGAPKVGPIYMLWTPKAALFVYLEP